MNEDDARHRRPTRLSYWPIGTAETAFGSYNNDRPAKPAGLPYCRGLRRAAGIRPPHCPRAAPTLPPHCPHPAAGRALVEGRCSSRLGGRGWEAWRRWSSLSCFSLRKPFSKACGPNTLSSASTSPAQCSRPGKSNSTRLLAEHKFWHESWPPFIISDDKNTL